MGFIRIFQNALFIEMSQKKVNMGVSKNRGIPKWMVKIMENPIKMDDLGVFPLFLETPTCFPQWYPKIRPTFHISVFSVRRVAQDVLSKDHLRLSAQSGNGERKNVLLISSQFK